MSTRLERMLDIVAEINRGAYPSRAAICHKFGIAERTVYDDITFINDRLGLDIRFSKQYGGYFNADPKKKLPEFDLFESELMALNLSRDMMEALSGTTFCPELEQALEKITRRMPPELSNDCAEELRAMIRFKAGGVATVQRALWFDIKKACDEQKKVDIEYFTASTGELKWRTVDPYLLVAHAGAWYLVAHCNLRQDVRMFALHRIRQYKVSEQDKFTIPEGFDAKAHAEKAFLLEHGDGEQHFVIRFTPVAARYVAERRFHETQKITIEPDGSCTMEFTGYSFEEAKRFILPYGAGAEVLEPPELRRRMKEELSNALSRYQH